MSGSHEPEALWHFAEELADVAAEVIQPYFAAPDLAVEMKADQTVVTLADKGAEEAMRKRIAEAYPEHGIWGEEYGQDKPGAEYVWVLDPIDGTKSFVAGNAQYGTLVALLRNGQPILGVINAPSTGQRIIGDGTKTLFRGQPTQTRKTTRVEEAWLLTTELWRPAKFERKSAWEDLCARVERVYTWGDCYGYLLLCTGGADIVCDPRMSIWDYMALIPAVRGAGGTVTDWYGNDPVGGHSILAAATPQLHAQALALLNSGR